MLYDRKKLAAIASAISAYITEEEKFYIGKPAIRTPAGAAWRLSAVMETMEMRRMVQLRLLKDRRR